MRPATHGHRVRRAGALCCLLWLAWAVAPSGGIAAQTVVGTVLDARSSRPLSGVLVSLLDFDGSRVDATLSDEDGTFAFDVGRFGRFRLRAERIGLQTSTSAAFDLFGTAPHRRRILMGERAVEIAGLVVDSRIEQCRLDPEAAVRIQRWWQEVRTALDVSSVVQSQGMLGFRVERFERAWDPSLSVLVAASFNTEMGLTSQPFVSADARVLSQRGFVQGPADGTRDYFAPDADVLLSDIFLGRHCFTLSDHDDEALLGLSFRPVRSDVADISGTLWVDTTSAQLQSLEYRYENVPDLPGDRAGGFVAFEYLPLGEWIVNEWYIRMPSLTRQGDDLELTGYVEVGARARVLEAEAFSPAEADGVGAVRGVVWDSVSSRGLEGARVTVVGTDLEAVADASGEFILPSVPRGERLLTFTHPEPSAWGLGPPLVSVDVREHVTADTRLAVPGFRRVAATLCQGGGLRARAVLVGDVVGADEAGLADVVVVLSWPRPGAAEAELPARREVRADPDGHFVACSVPPGVPVSVDVRVDGVLVRGYRITLPEEGVAYRRLQLPLAP